MDIYEMIEEMSEHNLLSYDALVKMPVEEFATLYTSVHRIQEMAYEDGHRDARKDLAAKDWVPDLDDADECDICRQGHCCPYH